MPQTNIPSDEQLERLLERVAEVVGEEDAARFEAALEWGWDDAATRFDLADDMRAAIIEARRGGF